MNIDDSIKLRYVELEPNRIFNLLDPKNLTCWRACPDLHDKWDEPETLKLRKQFGKSYTEEFDRITKHFTKLEESIIKDGILHPINAASGALRDIFLCDIIEGELFPFKSEEDKLNAVYSHTFGGSRLTIAQKYNIAVPCIVHDFSNLFEACEEVTKDNFQKWFGYNNYMIIDQLPRVRLKKHCHIDNTRYNYMSGETKGAQRKAVKYAKEGLDV